MRKEKLESGVGRGRTQEDHNDGLGRPGDPHATVDAHICAKPASTLARRSPLWALAARALRAFPRPSRSSTLLSPSASTHEPADVFCAAHSQQTTAPGCVSHSAVFNSYRLIRNETARASGRARPLLSSRLTPSLAPRLSAYTQTRVANIALAVLVNAANDVCIRSGHVHHYNHLILDIGRLVSSFPKLLNLSGAHPAHCSATSMAMRLAIT